MKSKILKKLSFVVASAVLFSFAFSFATYAKSKENEIKKFRTKYNMKSISKEDLPRDVEALEFSSVEEAEKWIENFKASINNKVQIEDTDNALSPQSSGSKSASWNVGPFGTALAKLNLTAYYDYIWSSTLNHNIYDRCTNVSTTYTGLTIGVTWTQTGYTSRIGQGDGMNSYLSVNVDGIWTAYIFIEGIGNIYSSQDSFGTTWYGYP